MSRTADDYINSAYGEIDRVIADGGSLDGYSFVLSYDAYKVISNCRDFMLNHGLGFNALSPNKTFLGVPFSLAPRTDGVALHKTSVALSDCQRVPRSIEAPSITLAKALCWLAEIDEWWNMPVGKAVTEMMRISGGRVNPNNARTAFAQAVGELGLDVVDDG